MKMLSAVIRDASTGEIATYTENVENWSVDEKGFLYNWLEGNFSCDCNRKLFFERAKGNDPDVDDTQCSWPGYENVNRFQLLTLTLEGKIIYQELSLPGAGK